MPPAQKQKQTGAEQAAARSGDAKLPGATPAEAEPEAAAAALSAAAVEPASSSATEEEEEIDGGSFLGIDDVLPSHKGVYVVEGQVDSSTREESLWDGWETVRCPPLPPPPLPFMHGRSMGIPASSRPEPEPAMAHSGGPRQVQHPAWQQAHRTRCARYLRRFRRLQRPQQAPQRRWRERRAGQEQEREEVSLRHPSRLAIRREVRHACPLLGIYVDRQPLCVRAWWQMTVFRWYQGRSSATAALVK